MFGVIMTWIMLIFVIIGLIFIGRVIQQEDQKSQLSQLQRTTELWAESFSIRLSSDLDRLGQLTESLPQGSSFENVLPRLRVNARALMIDRDEIVEINFVDTSDRAVLPREVGVVIRQTGRDNVELSLKIPAGKRLRHRQEAVGNLPREQRRAVKRGDDGGKLRGAEDQAAAVTAPDGGQKNGDEHHCQYDLHRCIPVLSL